jgi:sulfotransferase famil protein
MIVIPSLRVGYQGIPKVATTSTYHWFYACLGVRDGAPAAGLERKRNHTRRYFLTPDVGCRIENTPTAVAPYQAYFRFALVRDPIRRFLSMYSNRVVHHRGLSRHTPWAPKLMQAGLAFEPQINELVARLDAYTQAATVIMHHARPMMDFLGPDLKVYDRLADISEAGAVMREIRAYWEREGMLDPLQHSPPELGRLQTGGPKLGLEVLSPESFERLLDYYRDDYAQIPLLDLQAIKNEYAAARSTGTAVPPIDFRLAQAKKKLRPVRIAGIVAEKEDCPLVQALKVNLPNAAPKASEPFALRGIVLLRSNVDSGPWRLTLHDGTKERACQWGLPSPKLARKFRDNPRAANARFRLPDVRLATTQPLQMYLQNGAGEKRLLLHLRAAHRI